MINLEIVIVADTSGILLVVPLPDSMCMPNTFPKASSVTDRLSIKWQPRGATFGVNTGFV
jgi:hypothetical protein